MTPTDPPRPGYLGEQGGAASRAGAPGPWLRRPATRDVGLALLLAVGAATASFVGSGRVVPVIVSHGLDDIWFDGDVPRVFAQMTDPRATQPHSHIHPLFPLLALSTTAAVRSTLGVDPMTAARLVTASGGSPSVGASRGFGSCRL